MSYMVNTFWGKEISAWEDIYILLRFNGDTPSSFKDLLNWCAPSTPQECVDIAFDLAEARAANYKIPVRKWIENILNNDKRPSKNLPDEYNGGL